MLRIIFSILFLLIFNGVYAEDKKIKEDLIPNELATLDHLIAATEESLKSQKALKEQIKEYQKILELFLKNSNDNDLLYKMVKTAYKTNEAIKKSYLTDNFSPEFISELNFFSDIAKKNHIPIPN